MTPSTPIDPSNGYEALAQEFMSGRNRSSVGVATVRQWAKALPPGAAVLDLGCGTGVPISEALVKEGCQVYGVDASPTLLAAFRKRFPAAPAECSAVEDSPFFSRTFDGIVAWGVMFLLSPHTQATLIRKVSEALKPAGRFLFTSPHQICQWTDILTGRPSISLGTLAYRQLFEANGLVLVDEADDEGDNHYYFVERAPGTGVV